MCSIERFIQTIFFFSIFTGLCSCYGWIKVSACGKNKNEMGEKKKQKNKERAEDRQKAIFTFKRDADKRISESLLKNNEEDSLIVYSPSFESSQRGCVVTWSRPVLDNWVINFQVVANSENERRSSVSTFHYSLLLLSLLFTAVGTCTKYKRPLSWPYSSCIHCRN